MRSLRFRKMLIKLSSESRRGLRGPQPPLIWVKRKKSEKEETPAKQAKLNRSPPPPHFPSPLTSRSGFAPVTTKAEEVVNND